MEEYKYRLTLRPVWNVFIWLSDSSPCKCFVNIHTCNSADCSSAGGSTCDRIQTIFPTKESYVRNLWQTVMLTLFNMPWGPRSFQRASHTLRFHGWSAGLHTGVFMTGSTSDLNCLLLFSRAGWNQEPAWTSAAWISIWEWAVSPHVSLILSSLNDDTLLRSHSC